MHPSYLPPSLPSKHPLLFSRGVSTPNPIMGIIISMSPTQHPISIESRDKRSLLLVVTTNHCHNQFRATNLGQIHSYRHYFGTKNLFVQGLVGFQVFVILREQTIRLLQRSICRSI